MSNKERKELRRLEKESQDDGAKHNKSGSGKVKSKKSGKDEAPQVAVQRVVGI